MFWLDTFLALGLAWVIAWAITEPVLWLFKLNRKGGD